MIHSISISGVLTLNMHALNNEGAEGNTMMTRMVDVIDAEGSKHTVNAISGDMFKHIQAEHLQQEAVFAGLPLCNGCKIFNANRICFDEDFTKYPEFTATTQDSVILGKALERCVIDDCEGILITSDIGKKRSIARKSCIEFGWVLGRPGRVTTDSYFHAKYVPEGRSKGSGAAENLGQNIFHRPASSGQYAINVGIDLYRISRNDITLEYALAGGQTGKARTARAVALLKSVLNTFVKPTGAHRNTQNPHIVNFEGVVTASTSAIPAPVVSALNGSYREEVERIAALLNRPDIGSNSVTAGKFDTLSEFTETLGRFIGQLTAERA